MTARVGSAYITERGDGYAVSIATEAGVLSVDANDYAHAERIKALAESAVEAGRTAGRDDAVAELRRFLRI